jgi:hypothetical protein
LTALEPKKVCFQKFLIDCDAIKGDEDISLIIDVCMRLDFESRLFFTLFFQFFTWKHFSLTFIK